jgi:hypothetical protein
MLHTFVGADREAVRETVREPMKDYLRSAAALIKQYAWAFPAFKRPAGVTNPSRSTCARSARRRWRACSTSPSAVFRGLGSLRHGRGLPGAGRDAEADRGGRGRLPDRLRRPTAQVLEGLVPLAEVLRRTNAPTGVAADDFSIAAQILRHGVTHLQCTPSMARMICMNDEARHALAACAA